MPPMISDDDASSASSGVAQVIPPKKSTKAAPAKTTKKAGRPAKPVQVEEDDEDAQSQHEEDVDEDAENEAGAEEDDDDEEPGEDEFVVEKILSHDFEKDGTLKYEIKWLGYDEPKDRTWEPEENLIGAVARLSEYHKKIGGKPEYKPATPKPRGRGKRKSQATEPTPDVETSTKSKKRKTNTTTEPAKKNGAVPHYKLPTGSWEDEVEVIHTIEEKTSEGKNGKTNKELFIFLQMKDGRQFEHSANVVRQKCPQKLLDYLLSKLVFKTNEITDDEDDDAADVMKT